MAQLKDNLPKIQLGNPDTIEYTQKLFLCGLHRSGTTLIHEYLRSYLRTAYLEGPVPENEGQHFQNIYPQAFHFRGAGAFAFYEQMNPPPITNPIEAERKKLLLLSQWAGWTKGENFDVFMEKSPPNLTKTAYLRSLFPKAKFLVITRHPAAVAGATKKWISSSLMELLFHWNAAHNALGNDKDLSYHLIRYEDFCKNPHHERIIKSR